MKIKYLILLLFIVILIFILIYNNNYYSKSKKLYKYKNDINNITKELNIDKLGEYSINYNNNIITFDFHKINVQKQAFNLKMEKNSIIILAINSNVKKINWRINGEISGSINYNDANKRYDIDDCKSYKDLNELINIISKSK